MSSTFLLLQVWTPSLTLGCHCRRQWWRPRDLLPQPMPLPIQIPALLLLVMSKVSSLSQSANSGSHRRQACSAMGCASRATIGLPLQLQFMEPLAISVIHTCTASCAATPPACHIPVASAAKLVPIYTPAAQLRSARLPSSADTDTAPDNASCSHTCLAAQ